MTVLIRNLLRHRRNWLSNALIRWVVHLLRIVSGGVLVVVGGHDLLFVDGEFWPRVTSGILVLLGLALCGLLPRDRHAPLAGPRVLVWHGATVGLVISALALWVLTYRFPTPFPTTTKLLLGLLAITCVASWPLPGWTGRLAGGTLATGRAKATVIASAAAALIPVGIAFSEASSGVGAGLADSPTVNVSVKLEPVQSGDPTLRAVRLTARFRNVSGTPVGVLASACSIYGDTVGETPHRRRSVAEVVHRTGLDPGWSFSPAGTTARTLTTELLHTEEPIPLGAYLDVGETLSRETVVPLGSTSAESLGARCEASVARGTLLSTRLSRGAEHGGSSLWHGGIAGALDVLPTIGVESRRAEISADRYVDQLVRGPQWIVAERRIEGGQPFLGKYKSLDSRSDAYRFTGTNVQIDAVVVGRKPPEKSIAYGSQGLHDYHRVVSASGEARMPMEPPRDGRPPEPVQARHLRNLARENPKGTVIVRGPISYKEFEGGEVAWLLTRTPADRFLVVAGAARIAGRWVILNDGRSGTNSGWPLSQRSEVGTGLRRRLDADLMVVDGDTDYALGVLATPDDAALALLSNAGRGGSVFDERHGSFADALKLNGFTGGAVAYDGLLKENEGEGCGFRQREIHFALRVADHDSASAIRDRLLNQLRPAEQLFNIEGLPPDAGLISDPKSGPAVYRIIFGRRRSQIDVVLHAVDAEVRGAVLFAECAFPDDLTVPAPGLKKALAIVTGSGDDDTVTAESPARSEG